MPLAEASFKGDALHSKINEQKCHFPKGPSDDGAQRQSAKGIPLEKSLSLIYRRDFSPSKAGFEMTEIDVVH